MKILLFVFVLLTLLFFYPSDGASFTRKLGNCPKNGYKTATFPCDKKCIIKSATVRFKKGGNVDIVGREGRRLFTPLRCGRKCFCRGFTPRAKFEKCFKKRGHKIRTGIVSFVMKCRKFTRNVRFSVYGNIRPRKKTPKARKRIIGNMLLRDVKSFQVRCSGSCDVKYFYASYNNGGLVYLHGSESPDQDDILACSDRKCICEGKKNPAATSQTCEKRNSGSSNSIYFMVIAYQNTDNVILHFSIANFVSINPFTPVRKLFWNVGDLTSGETKFFQIKCNGRCGVQELYVIYKNGGLIYLHGSESPVKTDLVTCPTGKCFCLGQKNPAATSQTCSIQRSVSGDSFFLMVKPTKNTDNIFLYYKIVNLSKLDVHTYPQGK